MPLVVTSLEQELNSILETAATRAYKDAINVGNKLTESNINDVASAFGKSFANNASSDIASAIDKYIRSGDVLVATPTGPGTGKVS